MGQPDITAAERDAVYKTIFGRRDIRKHFTAEPIPVAMLGRILKAAHHAGSVGYMQPWSFIVVDDVGVKARVRESFLREREAAAEKFDAERREKYLSYKLEGILESPLNICVTCDRNRIPGEVIGRNSMRETDVYSTVCAVQNLWLAARAENIGVGWVSILNRQDLHEILNIPPKHVIVAYLCLGYVSEFPEIPELEAAGWRSRLPLEDLVYFNQWNGKLPEIYRELAAALKD
ncbi:MAG: 5,6-dimethylbenzimidazole synthase [Candidatus Omnitrophota bacterium]|nr:5,6-dimethylbenzimidazole synthase [Candidatus Omnitrophota bacterium]